MESVTTNYTHLIIVCCHAIYLGGPANGLSENEWLIEPFQKGETPTFMNHVRAALNLLHEDDDALLVFSGGATKQSKTSLTEAESYHNLSKANNYFSDHPVSPGRILEESHATDSYQNVLFSLLRFRLHTGNYPTQITVVTHEFKRGRFFECHFPALGLVHLPSLRKPGGRDDRKVEVLGINPPPEITSVESLVSGEEKAGIGLWRRDLYGVGPELAGKRAKRGWTAGMGDGLFVGVGLEGVIEELVRWDGGQANEWFGRMGELPWYHSFVRLNGE